MFVVVIAATFIATLLWVLVANATAPQTTSGSLIVINLAYFFGTLFVSLAGIVTVVLYSLGTLGLKKTRTGSIESIHKPRAILRRSLRHGILAATVICGIGLLNALSLTNPLNVILLVSAGVLTEVYLFGH